MIIALWITIGLVCLVNLAFTMLAFSLMYRMVQRSLELNKEIKK